MHSVRRGVGFEQYEDGVNEIGGEKLTNPDSRVHDFDDGLAGLTHVGESRGGNGGWDNRCKADSHFRDDAEGSLCADEQLCRVESGRRLARSTPRFYHLARGKNNSLPENNILAYPPQRHSREE